MDGFCIHLHDYINNDITELEVVKYVYRLQTYVLAHKLNRCNKICSVILVHENFAMLPLVMYHKN